MAGYAGKHTNRERDTVEGQARDQVEREWGEMTGTVVSFDAELQTIKVQPDYQKRLNGKPTKLPELVDVPVRFPRMGAFIMTTPVRPGDKVSLRPQMVNSEEFHEGEDYVPTDARSRSLSDYEAFLDGGEPLSNPITGFNNNAFEIRTEDGAHRVRFDESGKFEITGNQGDWYDLMTQVVELLAADKLNVKVGSSAGSVHALENQSDYADIAGKMRSMTGAAGP